MKEKPEIKVHKNGPYEIKGLRSFSDGEGRTVSSPGKFLLCRCGRSDSLPYCDGAHVKSGFTDENRPDPSRNRVTAYSGKGITVNDNRAVCSHDGSCFGTLPEVFQPDKFKWIKPDKAPPSRIIETIKKCPSGALSYTLEGRRHRNYDNPPSLRLDRRGPANVAGFIPLNDPGGASPESEEHYSLCRCGKSSNKPFCDGSHQPGVFRYERNE